MLPGVHSKEKQRQKWGILVTGAGNRSPHQGSCFLSPMRRPFSALSACSSFLESSSSMGTGITCQTLRHLLKGDEKNIRCGKAEERQREECRGQGFDWDGRLASGSNVWLEGEVVISIVSPLKI